MFRAQTEGTPGSRHASILLLETLAVVIAFNASNCFRTTNYVKSIEFISIALTVFRVFWIRMNRSIDRRMKKLTILTSVAHLH